MTCRDPEISPKYPVMTLVSKLHETFPAIRLGVVARGCDERAYIETASATRLTPTGCTILGFACTAEDAQTCHCLAPYPKQLVVGTPPRPAWSIPWWKNTTPCRWPTGARSGSNNLTNASSATGCRNICPECFCEACAMEDMAGVEPGLLAPPFPTFHIIRAMHMASRCIACRECENTCPAHIPL